MMFMFRDKRKIFGAILGSLMFLSVIFALTYAFYEWRSDSTLVSFSITDASLFCESGVKTNTENLGPVLDYRNGNYQSFLVLFEY